MVGSGSLLWFLSVKEEQSVLVGESGGGLVMLLEIDEVVVGEVAG